MEIWTITGKTLTITWFVAVMMILVEYGNVLSVDRLRSALCGELASSPAGARSLVRIGIRSLSVSPSAALGIRQAFSSAVTP